MKQVILTRGQYTLTCLLPRTPAKQAVYFHGPAELAAQSADILEHAAAACVCITGEDWCGDLTPWPADRVSAKGEDFRGGADAYLSVLVNELLPLVEQNRQFAPQNRSIVGISLSGLFAVYAAYQTGLFGKLGSVSGSLWYDRFVGYMENHAVPRALCKAYFSVGNREKNAGNPRMQRVEACTRQAAYILEQKGVQTRFEINPGGHYAYGAARLRKALVFLLGQA